MTPTAKLLLGSRRNGWKSEDIWNLVEERRKAGMESTKTRNQALVTVGAYRNQKQEPKSEEKLEEREEEESWRHCTKNGMRQYCARSVNIRGIGLS